MKLNKSTPRRDKSVIKKALFATATVLLTAGVTTGASAGDRQKFNDYARVVHVEPLFRYVTVNVPNRVCTPQHQNHSNTEHHRRTANTHRHQSRSSSAVFIGGVIGGAIGHEVSKSINGHGSAGATIAGALIGSTLANSADQRHRQGNYGRNRQYVTSTQHQHESNRRQTVRQSHHRVHNRNNRDRNRHHQKPGQRCTTTTETRRERHNDGYSVTYMYKGRSFNTVTQHHPGNRIAVRVAISTH